MATLAFDTLRYARRLREAGVPEPQADVQAELMAEAFGFYADNLLTLDHFEAVLGARLAEQDAQTEKRFLEQNTRIDSRFAEQDARFARLERTSLLHTWMLGVIMVTLVIPQLSDWFG
ncbi:MAG: hypothetical protein AAF662_06360 [Pseudomonadota bacterium]